MANKTVAAKMRIKPDARVAVLFPAPGVVESLELPEGATAVSCAVDADVVLLFVTAHAELTDRFPAVASALGPSQALWLIYPKGSKAAGRDISRDTIWPMAESLGMRPVGMVSIDAVWSGFRLKRGE